MSLLLLLLFRYYMYMSTTVVLSSNVTIKSPEMSNMTLATTH